MPDRFVDCVHGARRMQFAPAFHIYASPIHFWGMPLCALRLSAAAAREAIV